MSIFRKRSGRLRAQERASQQLLLKIPQVAQLLGIGRTKVYDLIREGLPVVRLGRALRISSTSLNRNMLVPAKGGARTTDTS
jgi:excisionase family DNA binding protein